MNWNDVPLFLAVADHGTLAGAARALGLNHSTVFRRLAALEDAVGARLFDRLPDGYVLTASGAAMLPLARAAESSMADIRREIVGHDEILAGPVRITTAPNLARIILPPAVAALRQQYPGIRLEIIVSDIDYDLNRREADIAFRATTSPPGHLVGRKVKDLKWYVFAPRSMRHTPNSINEIGDYPLIGADASLMRLKVFQQLQKQHDTVATANDLSTMRALAEAGVGLCVLPSDQPGTKLKRLFTVPGASGQLWLLTHPDLHRIPRVKAVWDAIHEASAKIDPMIDRRLVLTALLAAALTGRASANKDLDDPATLLTAFMRLAGSLDDRLIIWWMDGYRYGIVDARAELLFGMKVGMFHRFFRQPDGSFRLAMFELTYYTDLETGKLLEVFDNPYTGEQNKVRHVRLGPEIRRQTKRGIARPGNPLVAEYASTLGPALVHGGQVWIPTDVEATIKFPKPDAPTIELSHYTTVHGRLDDALNQNLLSAPCQINFQNVLKWEPFMKMRDHRGHMMSRAAGRKLESKDELPADYLSIAERQHGKFIADPVATLAKLSRQIEAEMI